MRIMPFMKRKKGVQFAGIGLDTGGGGGGGGSSTISISATPTKIGKYDGNDLYVVKIPVEGVFTSDTREYVEKNWNVDKIVNLSARYDLVLINDPTDRTQCVDGDVHLYGGYLGATVDVSYSFYENKDCFIYSVRSVRSGLQVTNFEIIAYFTESEV